MGTLRFYYNCLNSPYPEIVEKSIRAFVNNAETKSASTCEVCGKYGQLRVSKRALYFTVCEEHKEDSITTKEYEELVLKKRAERLAPEYTI
jgi:ssDNA-binding Zn-finger/Zn-ribbon topoisomerase 1